MLNHNLEHDPALSLFVESCITLAPTPGFDMILYHKDLHFKTFCLPIIVTWYVFALHVLHCDVPFWFLIWSNITSTHCDVPFLHFDMILSHKIYISNRLYYLFHLNIIQHYIQYIVMYHFRFDMILSHKFTFRISCITFFTWIWSSITSNTLWCTIFVLIWSSSQDLHFKSLWCTIFVF